MIQTVPEKNMALSRREFLTHSTMSAASMPVLLGLDIDYCDALPTSTIDWSMGFPKWREIISPTPPNKPG